MTTHAIPKNATIDDIRERVEKNISRVESFLTDLDIKEAKLEAELKKETAHKKSVAGLTDADVYAAKEMADINRLMESLTQPIYEKYKKEADEMNEDDSDEYGIE